VQRRSQTASSNCRTSIALLGVEEEAALLV
jgi:hypothetical protein